MYRTFAQRLGPGKNIRSFFCGRTFVAKIREYAIKKQAKILKLISNIDPPDLRNKVYRSIEMTSFLTQINPNGNHGEFRIPTWRMRLYRDSWLIIFDLSKASYDRWSHFALKERAVISYDHGLTGSTSNNERYIARAAIRRLLKDVADVDGTLLPVSVPRNSAAPQYISSSSENVIVLPPRYS